VRQNPGWGAPRIHGELMKLGFEVSERTVSRCLPRRPPDPGRVQRWKAFLRNHREVLGGMDFFTVPTAGFRLLYVFVVMHHARRTVLHVNVTAHPRSSWVTQQLRDAIPSDTNLRYLIFDRDAIFSSEVVRTVKSFGLKAVRTTYRSPWQNGALERWIGSCRRELLDHVVVFNEDHLRRLLNDYLAYYHEDRTHLALGKDTPDVRSVQTKPFSKSEVISLPRVGGIHHRYVWSEAA
jgi:putative transposase